MKATTRATAALALAILLLAAPSATHPGTFCVPSAGPSCAGTSMATIEDALAAAQANGGSVRDRIQVAAGTYAGVFVDAAGNTVDLVGAGVGQTILSRCPVFPCGGSLNTTLEINEPSSTVSDLEIRIAPVSQNRGLRLMGAAERVTVALDAGSTKGVGVLLAGGARFRQGTVDVPDHDGMIVGPPSGVGPALIEDVLISGRLGVQVLHPTLVRRVRLTATVQGIIVVATSATVESTLIQLLPQTQSVAEGLVVRGDTGGSASCTADHVTLVGPESPGSNAVHALATFGGPSTVTIRNSVIRGFEFDLTAGTTDPGLTSEIVIDFSAYDPAKKQGNGTFSEGANGLNVDPLFVDQSTADFRLRPDSPMIDRGSPEALADDESPTDLAGTPRILDGDGDCMPHRDIGAYETRAAPVAVATAMPATAVVNQPVTFDASGSCADEPGAVLTYDWSFDDGTAASGAVVSKTFATPGTYAGTVIVTDPVNASASTTASVSVACAAEASYAALDCRLAELANRTDGLGLPQGLERRLGATLSRARTHLGRAAGAATAIRAGRAARSLRKAIGAVRDFARAARARSGRSIPPDVLGLLLVEAAAIRANMQTLRREL